MALLRVPCFPQLSTKHNHVTAFSSSDIIDNKPYSKSSLLLSNHQSTNLKLSHSSFHFQSLSLTHKPNLIRTKETINFTFRLASTSQEQIQETEEVTEVVDTEEFSRTRLLAQNVPWTSTPEDIRSLFEKHGKVVEVELSMYNKSRNRGLAFVEMASPEDAQAALNSLESYEYEGRVINVKFARPKKERTSTPGQRKPITFNLFVANLPYEARTKDLKEFFDSGASGVVSAEVVFQENPRRPAGYGFVSFKTKDEANAALSEFQGKTFMGRSIRVAPSKRFVQQAAEETAVSEDTSSELNVNEAETAVSEDTSSELNVNEAETVKAD